MTIDLTRYAVKTAYADVPNQLRREPNPGLLIRRGITKLSEGSNQDQSGNSGIEKAKLIETIAKLKASQGYEWAYRRWLAATTGPLMDSRELTLSGRLYIGVVRDNPLETGVTVAQAWGMPFIPGSAQKGVARQAARRVGMDVDTDRWLFGEYSSSADGETEEGSETGIVTFHDAWWCPHPQHRPFVADVVTPHHSDYYAEGANEATDFDSPVPAPQIAVTGGFRFVVSGPDGWRELAMGMLTRALTTIGIGGKTTTGYGLFHPSA